MHKIQRAILELSRQRDLSDLKLREIGELVGEPHPQKIKHHLTQLTKKNLLGSSGELKKWQEISVTALKSVRMNALPILGSANCGEAMLSADEMFDGYLNVSDSILPKSKSGFFVLKARGNSMDRANVYGESIESGDYVIVDPAVKNPKNGDYVLSVINGAANIKKFVVDKERRRVLLMSESKSHFPPIIIHADDHPDYFVNGKVIGVVKKPL